MRERWATRDMDVNRNGNTVRHLRRAATAVLVLMLTAACGGAILGGGGDLDLLEGDWILVEGHGPDGEVPVIEGHNISLSIASDGTWGGTAACNAYGAAVEVSGGGLEIDELFQTEMACEAEGVMDAEQRFLAAFAQIDGFSVDGDMLTLHNEDDTELAFERRARTPDAE
jgi:heat shock protein HslJ